MSQDFQQAFINLSIVIVNIYCTYHERKFDCTVLFLGSSTDYIAWQESKCCDNHTLLMPISYWSTVCSFKVFCKWRSSHGSISGLINATMKYLIGAKRKILILKENNFWDWNVNHFHSKAMLISAIYDVYLCVLKVLYKARFEM